MSTRKVEKAPVPEKVLERCYHCGDACSDGVVAAHEKIFCCEGCKLVYEILQDNQLCGYYEFNASPGSKELKNKPGARYDFLDDTRVRDKLISFTDGDSTHITFFIPQIHCSSCIWLLEHLYRLNQGIVRSTVNFLKREVSIVFLEKSTSVREIAELLNRIGYSPKISLDQLEQKSGVPHNRQNWYRLGVAFFCFGNIMLISFPEYFGLDHVIEKDFRNLFGYLNILLSLPVLLYADTGFFKSAYHGLRQGRLNMDFPISLGIVVMYGRSLFEILSGTGAGYMDTFAGLIFFMLSGRLFQDKSYERLSFERDYKSYFPVAVTVIDKGREISKSISELQRGDRMLIRNEELIPADSMLIRGDGRIDYSFVTGESMPVSRKSGDRLFAGGKQTGAAIELEVISEVSQSRLTQLWNESNFNNHEKSADITSITDQVSKIFTIVVILVACTAGAWYVGHDDWHKALNAFTAVLIITCPCALALSYPFTLGNSIRIYGRNGLYLKNTRVIEKLSYIDTVVFDKTGTLTHAGEAGIGYTGQALGDDEKSLVLSLCSQSNHPLSRMIARHLSGAERQPVSDFAESPGTGIEGVADGRHVRVGSGSFTGAEPDLRGGKADYTCVHIAIDGVHKGVFTFKNVYRTGWRVLVQRLARQYNLHLISGDNNGEQEILSEAFGNRNQLHFNQKPDDKLKFIKSLQEQHKRVAMLGDGLNDAGALIKSEVGIAVTDNVNNFSPASDGILEAGSMNKLPEMIRFARSSMRIIFASYVISLLYNTAGTYIAVQGELSPLFAAIIMPVSTVTIVLFTTVASTFTAHYAKLRI